MLLNFGSGAQALLHFTLCFVSILSTIQISATQSRRNDLRWLDARPSFLLGAVMIAASFGWLFAVNEQIFDRWFAIGEIIILSLVAFAVVVPTTRIIAFLTRWVTPFLVVGREKETSQ